MQHVFTLSNSKGGAGKSTSCLSLALTAQRDLHCPVYVVDFDPQATSLRRIMTTRTEDDKQVLPLIAMTQMPSGNFDGLVFVDTPGLSKSATRRAADLADTLIIPVQPSADDLEAALFTMAFALEFGKRTCWLPTRVQPSRLPSKFIHDSLRDMMDDQADWPILPGIRDLAGAHYFVRGEAEQDRRPTTGPRPRWTPMTAKGSPDDRKFEKDCAAAWAALKEYANL